MDKMNNTNEKKDELLELFSKLDEEKSEQKSDSENNPEDISEKITNFENDIFRDIEEKAGKKRKERKNGRAEKVLLIIFAALMLVSVVGLSIYCIITDIMRSDVNSMNGGREHFALNVTNRPFGEEAYMDENGKYTIEGLAAVVKPQIVEIYTYSDKNSDVITGTGSGIIVSQDGYIVTNTHVLDGMEKYVVKTHDGNTYNAELKGRDAKTDIAIVKVNVNGLMPAQFGNSDQVMQGESVVCVGNPAGLTGSITEGIVSGLNRKIKTEETGFEMNCIQTDAAISPGNSGGALVNMYGQVIGITSSKYATTTTEGLGFAITINDAKPIIEELINQGYVSGRVRIGITFYSSYANYMEVMFEEEFGFEIPKELENSLWIEEISKDCDIANTELKPDDFIISIDGINVSDYDGLEKAIRGKVGGDTVTAKCARISKDGKISYFDIEFKLMTDTSGDF